MNNFIITKSQQERTWQTKQNVRIAESGQNFVVDHYGLRQRFHIGIHYDGDYHSRCNYKAASITGVSFDELARIERFVGSQKNTELSFNKDEIIQTLELDSWGRFNIIVDRASHEILIRYHHRGDCLAQYLLVYDDLNETGRDYINQMLETVENFKTPEAPEPKAAKKPKPPKAKTSNPIYAHTVGKAVEQKGIFVGAWQPKIEGFKKTFNLYAAPQDLDTLMTYSDAFEAVKQLKKYHGHDGSGFYEEDDIYRMLREENFDRLCRWFIPPIDILKILFKHKDKHDLSGTFEDHGNSDFAPRYWSSTRDETDSRFTHNFYRGERNAEFVPTLLGGKYVNSEVATINSYALSTRLVRAELKN